MAGNLLQVGSSDGKLRIKSDGIVVAGASDPCCCDGVACTNCDTGSGASQYQVIIAGWTGCTCVDRGVGVLASIVGDLNGTWTLDYDAGNSGTILGITYCSWKVTTDLYIQYYDSGCPGTPSSSDPPLDMSFRVYKSGTHYYAVLTIGGGGGGEYQLFKNTIDNGTSKIDCASEFDFTNDFTACEENIGGIYGLGYGGTGAVTAI